MSHSPASIDGTNNFTPAAGYNANTQQQPIVTQPKLGEGSRGRAADTWMAIPAQVPGTSNVPPGLRYLMTIDHLFVEQQPGRVAFALRRNKYVIKNKEGQLVYFAFEEDSGWSFRRSASTRRLFDIHVLDNQQNEIIHFRRHWPCCTCDNDELHVFSPPGNLVGKVKRPVTFCTPEFEIVNESGTKIMRILGPPSCCNFVGSGSVDFNIVSRNKSVNIGRISRHWGGFWPEAYTDLDIFGVSFPVDLDVRMKAVLLGACFTIDFVFFESRNYYGQQRDSPFAIGAAAAAGAAIGAAAAAD